MQDLIVDTAERIFADNCPRDVRDAAESGVFPEDLWAIVREAGLHLLGSQESGTSLADALRVIGTAGRHALPLPYAEIVIGNRFAGDNGLTTIAQGDIAAWGRRADRVLFVDGTLATEFEVEPGTNLAGEPRDRVAAQKTEAVELPDDFDAVMALARVAGMSGALDRVLELALRYASEREQFGRPLSKFQAIQHNLARLAGEVAASKRATDAAIEAVESPWFRIQTAAAKSRVGEAAGISAEIAHQVHGAMGFTHEHELHHFTRRLWAWRDEYGIETQWQAELGQQIAALGADNTWGFITRSLPGGVD